MKILRNSFFCRLCESLLNVEAFIFAALVLTANDAVVASAPQLVQNVGDACLFEVARGVRLVLADKCCNPPPPILFLSLFGADVVLAQTGAACTPPCVGRQSGGAWPLFLLLSRPSWLPPRSVPHCARPSYFSLGCRIRFSSWFLFFICEI